MNIEIPTGRVFHQPIALHTVAILLRVFFERSILSAQSERFYALDAVRAFALILGIFYHGVFSFADTIPPAVWPIKDSSMGFSVRLFIYGAHIFRMQTFFLIAGFFAHLLYQRRGPTGFLLNRAKRIFLPFLIFLPFIFLANVTLYSWGWKSMGVYDNVPYGKLSVWQRNAEIRDHRQQCRSQVASRQTVCLLVCKSSARVLARLRCWPWPINTSKPLTGTNTIHNDC